MTAVNEIFLFAAALLAGGIALGALSSRMGVPLLLVFLIVGMAAGEDGPGGFAFDDHRLAFLIGNLALAVILLDGGLRTRLSSFRVALAPSLALATFGVAATAAMVGLGAVWLLGLDWRTGLALGAIVGSTDAAAVFALLRANRVRLNDRTGSTLEIESGVNDPMAIFLTLSLVQAINQPGGMGGIEIFLDLVAQLVIGTAGGVLGGRALSAVIGRLHITEGLSALFICAAGLGIFALTNLAGGSGFLAAYLVGLIVGNRKHRAGEDVLRAMDGMAWLAQSGMFLLLGLLVTPSELARSALPALGVAALLMFVARPLAVWVTLLPFRFPWRETAFIGWVGLRGAVPIVLALFPLLAGVPHAQLLFNVAFVVVLASLLVQGMTIGFAARRLAVALPPQTEPALEVPLADGATRLFEFEVNDASGLTGAAFASLDPPGESYVASILRDGRPVTPEESPLRTGDRILVVSQASAADALVGYFTSRSEAGTATARSRYGDFVLDPDAPLDDVLAAYDGALDSPHGGTLGDMLSASLPRAVVGDQVRVGRLRFTVREMREDKITQVGLKLD
jgi:cell volume regulation protein A